MATAADLAAAIQLSINEHIVSIPPSVGILPAPPARHDSSHSRDGRVSPAIEYPSIKAISELKDHLSVGSLFKMKREWLSR